MKIRYDYVTNSSSSSFLLGFKNGESIEQVLNEGFGYLAPVVTPYVMKDIASAKKMDFDGAKEYIKKEIYYDVLYDVWVTNYAGNDITTRNRWDAFSSWVKSDEGQKRLNKFFDEHWASEFKRHPEYTMFVVLEYGNEMADYDDANDMEIQIDLESNFMDKLHNHLIASFGHH